MKKIAIVALLPLFLVACGKGSDTDYVGHWTKVSGQGPDMTIEKRGDMFIVKQPNPMFSDETMDSPAQIKDGVLKMPTGMGGDVSFIIDKSTGHLLIPGEELQRASK
jgi:hypothetical protein